MKQEQLNRCSLRKEPFYGHQFHPQLKRWISKEFSPPCSNYVPENDGFFSAFGQKWHNHDQRRLGRLWWRIVGVGLCSFFLWPALASPDATPTHQTPMKRRPGHRRRLVSPHFGFIDSGCDLRSATQGLIEAKWGIMCFQSSDETSCTDDEVMLIAKCHWEVLN